MRLQPATGIWALGALIVVSLRSTDDAGHPRVPRRMSEADQGQTIELRTGEQLQIALSGNPSTGYNWEVTAFDPAILQSVGDIAFEQTPQHTRRPIVGAGGTLIATFAAVAAGTTTVELCYRRPWEPRNPADQAFAVVVVVR